VPPSFDYFWRFTKQVEMSREASGLETGDFIDRLKDMKNQLKKGERNFGSYENFSCNKSRIMSIVIPNKYGGDQVEGIVSMRF
jgi:hypothetical protein